MLQQSGFYLPHILFWHCVCCERTLIDIYFWWVTSEIIAVIISDRDELWQWEIIPSFGGDAHHETTWFILNIHLFLVLLIYQGDCSHIFLVWSSWMLLNPLWDLFLCSIHCFPHRGIYSHNHCRWCGQFFFWVFFLLFCFAFLIPSFSTMGKH